MSQTIRELLASAYLTPQELATETGIPLKRIVDARNGGKLTDRELRRVLRVVKERTGKQVMLSDIEKSQIEYEE